MQRQPRKKKGLQGLCLASALAIVLGLGWYENRSLRLTAYTLPSPRLPLAFDGLRIVQLSDLHGARFGKDSRRLLSAVKKLSPELIALTGDLVDRREEFSLLPPLLTGLCELAPTVYITGNHEWAMPPKDRERFFALLEQFGVTRLENSYRLLRRGQEQLVLAGVDDINGPLDQKTPAQLVKEIRSEQSGDPYILMLSHRNDQLPQWSALQVDTVLSGHAHGGVVRLPGLGPIFGTHLELLPDDAEGVYREGRTALVVSRGLGQSKKLPFRLGNRPEVTLVILETEQ